MKDWQNADIGRNLVSLGSEFKVGAFDNGINRACFLAEATVYALGHINIIPAIVIGQ